MCKVLSKVIQLYILTFFLKYFPLWFGASLVAQLVKNQPAMWETWVGKIPWRREQLSTLVFWPGEFQGLYSLWGCKELDTIEQLSLSFPKYSPAKEESWIQSLGWEDPLEKGTATHFGILAWRIPWIV